MADFEDGPNFMWMWGDENKLATFNPVRWSEYMTKAAMVEDLDQRSDKDKARPIHMKDRKRGDWRYKNVEDAVRALRSALPTPGLPLKGGGQIPFTGLGTWGGGGMSGKEEVAVAVREALVMGYRSLDLAESYNNEAEIGVEIRKFIAEGGCAREDLFVTSKLWNTNHAPDKVKEACENTLEALGIGYLDLYLVHWPLAWKYIGKAPFPEGPPFKEEDGAPAMERVGLHQTWAAMEELVDAGKVKHIGVSNYNSTLLGDLLSYCRIPPAVNQVECHPYLQQRNLFSLMKKHDIVLACYSPLGRPGQNTAREGRACPELLKDPVVTEIAHKHNVPPSAVVLAWSVQRGSVVLPKSANPERLLQNLEMPGNCHLSAQEMQKIDALDGGHRYCDLPWNHGLYLID